MKKCYIILGSAVALAIITSAALFHYANRDHYVIHVVNTTNTQIEHVRVRGLDENGALGVLLPGAGKSVDMKGKAPGHAISLRFWAASRNSYDSIEQFGNAVQHFLVGFHDAAEVAAEAVFVHFFPGFLVPEAAAIG